MVREKTEDHFEKLGIKSSDRNVLITLLLDPLEEMCRLQRSRRITMFNKLKYKVASSVKSSIFFFVEFYFLRYYVFLRDLTKALLCNQSYLS